MSTLLKSNKRKNARVKEQARKNLLCAASALIILYKTIKAAGKIAKKYLHTCMFFFIEVPF
jgi:hypothetical protein